jgi:hypothetical protein
LERLILVVGVVVVVVIIVIIIFFSFGPVRRANLPGSSSSSSPPWPLRPVPQVRPHRVLVAAAHLTRGFRFLSVSALVGSLSLCKLSPAPVTGVTH